MPRKPDLPCADCGKLMQRHKDSLPEGEARCHPCRRDAPKPERVYRTGPPCPECGTPLAYKSKGVQRCRACSAARPLRSVPVPVTARACATCGADFTPKRRSAFCSDSCRNRRPRGAIQDCECCGAAFHATYRGQRTCGRSCGAKINARIAAARLRSPSSTVVWRECSCGQHYTNRGGRRCGCSAYVYDSCRVFVTECRVCSRWFCSPHTVSTCSDVCAKAKLRRDRQRSKDKYRANKRNAYVADVVRADIYARDKYRCMLCAKKLKMTVVVPHPLAPVLDHVIPLARGGTHEPANVQAAHFLCNSRKADGGGGEQLALIG